MKASSASPTNRKRPSHIQTKIVLQGSNESFSDFEQRLNDILVEIQNGMQYYNKQCIPFPCCSADGRITMTIIYDKTAVQSKKTVVPEKVSVRSRAKNTKTK